METSILNSTKKQCGIAKDYTIFDDNIIPEINTVFADLLQMGVGPKEGFAIEDDSAEWSDFTQNDPRLAPVSTYVHLRVRMVFDPPTNSSVMEAMQRRIEEIEWRLNAAVDHSSDEE